MKLVIVESPAKAKTINKYLGKDYQVMASFGHIRDVPAKDGSVRPNEDFAMDWEVQARGERTVRDMVKALSKADALYLASDPDREGEAIAWHVVQELKRRKKLPDTMPIYRVVFHEITKKAILEAIQNPRDIDMQLVDAYMARRALDYLVGFQISPLLWRNLPGAKSAGRVQSVALRLVCEREDEITSFKPEEYWTVGGTFKTIRNEEFQAKLTHYNGKKLTKFDLNNETIALAAKEAVQSAVYTVGTIERKQSKRNPAPAFTTSTLQQEASRKLGFGAKKTMQLAQGLYEGVDLGGETVGLITYMRTDSVALSQEAIAAARTLIERDYGKEFLPEKPRVYKNNSKNAQEAHEAIRPTNILRTPDSIASYLTPEQRKLYELIWKRTVACQMESAVMDKVGIDIPASDGKTQFRATGQTIAFAGFIKVYKEDIDDAKEEDGGLLPLMNEGEKLDTISVLSEQHFTEPPPRFSEASLVKKLEELGIGRPSTYATILSVLQDREYVKLVAKKFIPEDRGRIVTAFMENYFTQYVQYDYTANLENKLDDITNGEAQWKQVLGDFWGNFDKTVHAVPTKMGEILEKVSHSLEKQIFPTEEARICPDCQDGKLSLHIGKFGAFIGCSNYPKCKHTKQYASITPPPLDENGNPIEMAPVSENQTKELGKNAAGLTVYLKKGPYGWYVQLGEGKESKRTGLPKGTDTESITIETALQLLSLPRLLGKDPKTDEPIEAGLGKFGPYVKRGRTYQSLEQTDNVLTIDFDRAIALLSASKEKKEAVEIGKWNDKVITYQIGRYGPYVKWDKIMASVKNKNAVPTLEEAITLLQDKMHQK